MSVPDLAFQQGDWYLIIFQTGSFDMHSEKFIPDGISDEMINLTYIMLTIIVPVFDLCRSFGKVKSGKSFENFWKFLFKSG